MQLLPILVGIAIIPLAIALPSPSSPQPRFRLNPTSDSNFVPIEIIGLDQSVLVTGRIGLGLPSAVGNYTTCNVGATCLQWGDFARVTLDQGQSPSCTVLSWTSSHARELEDCFDISPGVHWYGGGETWYQTWPIESQARDLGAYVTGGGGYSGIVESYWLLSNGVAIKADEETPLFVSLNTTRRDQVCFVARNERPYLPRSELTLKYEWCVAEDVLAAHKSIIGVFHEKPESLPDERMLVQPYWSTWAEFKTAVNQTLVLDYARRVISEGFINSSHIQIDDDWETCYGDEEWNTGKFPNAKAMVDEVKGMQGDMRVTLWVHPFVNYGCPRFDEGLRAGYFMKDSKSRTGLTSWWVPGGQDAAVIDVTNQDAVNWWTARLQKIQQDSGITSFKFDAGDVGINPADGRPSEGTSSNLWPNVFTTKFVDVCASFGGLVETRVAHKNQKQPWFVRMGDKDSRWGYDNGLQSLIPTLLQFSIVGYSWVLPDMIGGNAYNGEMASQELYVRWMQANIFMPSVQFSLVPWNIGGSAAERAETVRMTRKAVEQRIEYTEHILAAARQAVEDGSPMNRPLWWVDPTDTTTFTIDDEYMLGDSILVAPVVREGQVARDIYLPVGTWKSAVDSATHNGPAWLRNYPAPLDVVPFFVKM